MEQEFNVWLAAVKERKLMKWISYPDPPGPPLWVRDDQKRETIADENLEIVAIVLDTDTPQGQANLELILAAPEQAQRIAELVDACKAVAKALSHLEDVCDIDNDYEIKRLEKAIEPVTQ